jgi:hypothetical protein
LPYIYEADHLQDWEAQFFWTPRKPVGYVDPKTDKSRYYDGLDETKTIPDERKDTVLGPPLGEQLTDILINYLFFPNFTLPAKKDASELPDLKPRFVVWQSGIGANKGIGMTKENERNAMEVLRLLLALSSRAMYIAPSMEQILKNMLFVADQEIDVVAEMDIRPLTYLATQSDRQVILNTICSLLNTVSLLIIRDETYSHKLVQGHCRVLAWISSVFSIISAASYTTAVSPDHWRNVFADPCRAQVLKYNQNPWSFPIDLSGTTKDSKQPLVIYCLQFLLVLITYPVPNNGANEFRKALGRLHRAEDFQFIVEGLRQILMQPVRWPDLPFG